MAWHPFLFVRSGATQRSNADMAALTHSIHVCAAQCGLDSAFKRSLSRSSAALQQWQRLSAQVFSLSCVTQRSVAVALTIALSALRTWRYRTLRRSSQ